VEPPSILYHDADGQRVKQMAADGKTTLYTGQWYEVTFTANPADTVWSAYYYLGGQRVALRQGAVGQAGTVYWLHADHLGSTSEVSTATASLSERERYFPYGQVRYSSGTLPTTYTFTGQRLDGTGLLYYGARYYDPRIGRFVSADSLVQAGPKTPTPYLPLTVSYTETRLLERWNQRQRSHVYPSTQQPQPPAAVDPQSLNRYTYARNSPLAYIDNSGHLAWWVAGGIVGGVGGFVAYALTHQDNFDWGQAALWTAGGAVVGATFGAAAQYVATAVTATGAATTAATIATAACGDGNCTNEINTGSQTARVLLNAVSKADARAAIQSGMDALSTGQANKALQILRGGRIDSFSMSLQQNGQLQIVTQRTGADGFQQLIYTLDASGKTIGLLQVVYNNAGEVIHIHDKFNNIVIK